MNGRRIRLVLRVVALALTGLLVLLAITVVVLRLTNPRPHKSPRWKPAAQMPEARGEVASASVGSKLVVAGGLHGVGRTADSVYVYEVRRDEWTRTRSLPEPRHHAAAAGLGGHIYVSGGARGATDWEPTSTLWRALPGGTWRPRRPLPEGRQGHAMVALGGRLYIVGGVGETDGTLIYDPAGDRWTTGAPLPAGRDHLRAVAWGDEVWAIGGRNPSPTTRVDIYDPKRDAWRPGPDLPIAMSAMGVGIIADELHVVGGEDPGLFGGHVIREHFALAKGKRRWRTQRPPLLPVHGAGFATYQRRLYIAGGAARQGALSTISWTRLTQVFRPEGFVIRLAAASTQVRSSGLARPSTRRVVRHSSHGQPLRRSSQR